MEIVGLPLFRSLLSVIVSHCNKPIMICSHRDGVLPSGAIACWRASIQADDLISYFAGFYGGGGRSKESGPPSI